MRAWWAALALLCGTAAVAGAAEPAGSWDDVVAAARHEGKVVVYTAAAGQPYPEIDRLFSAEYGIPVQVLEGRASEIRQRIEAEQASGRAIGDLSLNGATTTAQQAARGEFQARPTLPNEARLLPQFAAERNGVAVYAQSFAILVNTRLVAPGQEPRSWHDLLDPRWRGKILSDDFRAAGTGNAFFAVMTDRFGADFDRALAAQRPVFTRDLTQNGRRVAQGEFPLCIPQILALAQPLAGLPVKLVLPSEGLPYVLFDFAVLKDAPHPNAARLLMNFYLQERAQILYANAGYQPATGGLAGKVAPEMQRWISAPLLGAPDPARQERMFALAHTLFP